MKPTWTKNYGPPYGKPRNYQELIELVPIPPPSREIKALYGDLENLYLPKLGDAKFFHRFDVKVLK